MGNAIGAVFFTNPLAVHTAREPHRALELARSPVLIDGANGTVITSKPRRASMSCSAFL